MTPRLVSFGTSGRRAVSKYRNVRTEKQGIKFSSIREANRYVQLQLLERNGEVRNIRLQPEYRCEVNGALICKYRADFAYEELHKGAWRHIVEDVKGFKTPAYRLKKKLMMACHNVAIRET